MRSVRLAILAVTALAAALLAAGTAAAQPQPYVGEVMLTGTNFCPPGWFEAQGQLLPINQYTPLFSLYGTNYGGDGKHTFGLPKLKPPKASNAAQGASLTYCIAWQGVFPSHQ